MRPLPGTYPDYYQNYIPLVKEDTICEALLSNMREVCDFFKTIPASKENFAYAPGKWTTKGVLNHLIDTERIFAYRALRFARKDAKKPLPFEQDDYVAGAETEKRSLADLTLEFETVRWSTVSLYKSFSEEALLRMGETAAGNASVLAIGYTVCGHYLHHMKVLKERYL